MKKTILTVILMAGFGLLASQTSFGQNNTAEYDKYIALLRQDLRSVKKQFVALNMPLTDVEATKFWPIYDNYTAEQSKLFDARLALIKEFAANFEKLSDATAASLTKRSTAVDQSLSALRLKYVPLVGKVLPGRKSALFFQLDKRIGLLIDLQLASEIPLVVQ